MDPRGESPLRSHEAPATESDPTVTRWRAAASPGGLIGALLVVICALFAAVALAALIGIVGRPLPTVLLIIGLVIFVALAIGFGYLVYGFLTIGYTLSEAALEISWAGRHEHIDFDAIKQLGPATELIAERPGRWQRFWPGYYVGVQQREPGPVRVVASLPLRRQLLVVTDEAMYAISPERPILFVEEYGRLRRARDLQRTGGFPTVEPGQGARRLADAGWTNQFPVQPLEPVQVPDLLGAARAAQTTRSASQRQPDVPDAEESPSRVEPALSPALRPSLLSDTTALALLAAAVLIDVAMVVFILVERGSFPQTITLHWNANGTPDRVGSPREIWVLPLITGIVTVANFGLAWTIVTFDRFAARFLLGATCIVQLVAWVALVTLTR